MPMIYRLFVEKNTRKLENCGPKSTKKQDKDTKLSKLTKSSKKSSSSSKSK